ncbi:hypothetical protein TNCV_3546001 [Trichonephila clavipes]|nr:hypothetical protein TNCV_3546001 [Trichonephila clavipes]
MNALHPVQWLATLTDVPLKMGSKPREDMDVCKCIVPSRHGGTLNSRRADLVRLVEGRERFSQTKTNGNVRLIRPAFELALSSLSPLLSSSLEPINRLVGFIKPKRLLQEVLRLVLKAKH